MFKQREGFLPAEDGTKLFFQVWENPKAKGTIIISPGHGEHSDSYVRVVNALKDDRWTIFCFDQRGHGRSDGKRGYAVDFEVYCRDYFYTTEKVLNELKNTSGPTVLLSHSMGGLIQLKTLIDHPELKVEAQVCSAPLMGVAVVVPAWKTKGAEMINKWMPTLTLSTEITNEMVTRDPDVIRELEQDVLRHDRMSPGVYLGIQDAMVRVMERASEITIPTLMQIAEDDPVVSSAADKELFERLGSPKKKLLVYGEGARHEIYNDIMRETVFKDLKEFLNSVLEGTP
jgi:alpha-beta hydrolase superfamily lysophospholipase